MGVVDALEMIHVEEQEHQVGLAISRPAVLVPARGELEVASQGLVKETAVAQLGQRIGEAGLLDPLIGRGQAQAEGQVLVPGPPAGQGREPGEDRRAEEKERAATASVHPAVKLCPVQPKLSPRETVGEPAARRLPRTPWPRTGAGDSQRPSSRCGWSGCPALPLARAATG